MSVDRRAFITGSRAYGVPREDSDLDLVIYCDPETARALWALSQQQHPETKKLLLDNVNLVVTTEPEQYAAWERGTEALKSKPVPADRATAVEVMKAEGVRGDHES